MPRFDTVSMDEARARTASPERTQLVAEYLAYIEQLTPRAAGKLKPSEGENTRALRRRLGAAAKVSGKDLVVKTVGGDVYFWLKATRRGRPGSYFGKDQRRGR